MPFVSVIYIITRRQFISPFRGVERLGQYLMVNKTSKTAHLLHGPLVFVAENR